MDVNARELSASIRTTLNQIQTQLDVIQKDAESRINLGGPPFTMHDMVDGHGNARVTPLLVAKSNCLLALTNLREKK